MKNGSRFMIVSGPRAGEMGTVYEIDMEFCPEIIAVMDKDSNLGEERYSFVRYRDVIEV